jgi:hypothetical protein
MMLLLIVGHSKLLGMGMALERFLTKFRKNLSISFSVEPSMVVSYAGEIEGD